MRQIEDLQKQWQDHVRFRGVHAGMALEKDGLALGATVLAKRNHDGALALEGAEAQLLTLLAVAYGRPVDAAVLRNIRRASKHAQAGDKCMAVMHIALAGLPRLPDPDDAARRLFIADGLLADGLLADGLLADGVAPRDIFAALEFDPAPLDELEKYNSGEARNPKGDGHASGEWTIDGTSSSASTADAGAQSASSANLDTSMLQDAGVKIYPNVLSFVVQNGPAAERLADQVPGLTSDEILTALGCENKYGESPIAKDHGNYGGIHYVPGTPYFPGQTGTFLTAGNPPGVDRQLMASFPPENGFELSGQVLIDRIKPLVPENGIPSPEQFFALINAHGWGTTNAGYMNLTVGKERFLLADTGGVDLCSNASKQKGLVLWASYRDS